MVVAPRRANVVTAALVVLAVAVPCVGMHAQTAASIAEGDGIFIDGRTFEIVPRKGGGDAGSLITALGAREIGPGAIILRSGDRLYIAETPAGLPAAAAAGPQHDRISIAYEPPTNPEHQQVYELIKDRRVLEILKGLLSPFRLPVDLEIRTVGCDGVANAFFDRKGTQRSIRMCYEFLQIMVRELPNETGTEGTTRNDALIGQLALVLLHEAGHAIYDIFEVPILGSQEDAADQFAAYVLLQFGGERAYRLVRGAAHSFKRIIADIKSKPDVTLPLTAFSSEHSRPQQRFFNLACTAYGYDATLFASVIDEEWLPEKRARRCKAEYEDLTFALRRLVGPHVDKALARKVLDTRWLPEEGPAAR
jgi:Putative metallopeptidase